MDIKIILSKKSETIFIEVDFSTTQTYENTGLYFLDDKSYILVIKDYLREQEVDEVFKCAETLQFKQMIHKSGAKEARSTHHIGPSYSYGDITHDENHVWPQEIIKMKGRLENEFLCPLNSTLVNKYERHQFIPLHADDEDSLRDHPTIFSISVGETRTMVIKSSSSGDDNHKQVNFKLFPGTLVIMAGDTNKNWLHSVPKHNSHKQIRYNFTFRYLTVPLKTSTSESNILNELKQLKEKITHLESLIQKSNVSFPPVASNFNFPPLAFPKSYASVTNNYSRFEAKNEKKLGKSRSSVI